MCTLECTIVNMQVDVLFGESKVRRDLLVRFFARPGLERHVRELARETGWSPTIIGRELNALEGAGILRSERVGNLRRYSVDANSPVAREIRSLVQKTIGAEARVRAALVGLPGIEEAFLYGSYARGDERATSDLDLMIVGSVDQEALSEQITNAERDLGRDVNPTTYDRDELERLRREGDLFVESVWRGPRIQLLPTASD
jgi:predicted nucleotidyltransferase